ncbi:MAG: ribonuclease HII [Deltaproteobacteria bacterium]|nr:ribonuclease HII [Deltaproteobacteria bacterium]
MKSLPAATERRRLEELRSHERLLEQVGIAPVAGVDEVGMGPLAGPIVAAAVILPAVPLVFGVDDSKALTRPARERVESEIRRLAIAVGIGSASVAEIDEINVYQAGLLAMRRAVAALSVRPRHVLVDARTIPDLELPQTSFVKGDARVYSIAAASVVAKVHRDRLMAALEREHPGYGFAGHAGYATAEHREAIRRLGPSPVHRRSFALV